MLYAQPYNVISAHSLLPEVWYCIENLMAMMSYTWFLVANISTSMPSTAMFWEGHNRTTLWGTPFDQVWSIPSLNNSAYPCTPGSVAQQPQLSVCYQPVMPNITFDWSALQLERQSLSTCNVDLTRCLDLQCSQMSTKLLSRSTRMETMLTIVGAITKRPGAMLTSMLGIGTSGCRERETL